VSELSPIIDCRRLRERRLAAGLSQRQLGKALGVDAVLIMRLERGESHDSLPLHRLTALGRALGVSPASLLADGSGAPEPAGLEDDARQLCALLAELDKMVGRDELAEALNWPLSRVNDATRALSNRLHDSGLKLQSTWGLRLRGAAELVDADTLATVERAGAARRGLSLSTAALLRRAALGELDERWAQRASNPERVTLATLLRMGLIERSGSGYQVSADVEYSLRPGPADAGD